MDLAAFIALGDDSPIITTVNEGFDGSPNKFKPFLCSSSVFSVNKERTLNTLELFKVIYIGLFYT